MKPSNSGVIEALEDNLIDLRNPLRIRHSLASQLRTLVLQRAIGWIDLSDTDTLRRDPLWQLACSGACGMKPLAQGRPSQATLPRLLTCMGRNDNIDAVHEDLLLLVVWRLTSLKHGQRPEQLTLDIDGVPIDVHGHQGGSAFHGLYSARIYSPLVASLAETGDMVGGLLRSHIGLQKLAAPHLKRPPGRQPEQPREWCHDLEYQAGSWPTPRRVVLVVLVLVLVVQERPDDLLVHAFFLVTNLGKFDWPSEKILALSASEAAPRRTWARSSRRSTHTSHRLIAAPPLSRTRWPATR